MIIVKEISADKTYDIRRKVLRENIPLTEKIIGDLDSSTLHLGAFIKSEMVSVATFLKNEHDFFDGNQYRLGGMATLKEFQKKGFGKQLILIACKKLKEQKADVIWCNARVTAIDFYKKLGFQTKGDEFDIPLIGGHFIMFKNL